MANRLVMPRTPERVSAMVMATPGPASHTRHEFERIGGADAVERDPADMIVAHLCRRLFARGRPDARSLR